MTQDNRGNNNRNAGNDFIDNSTDNSITNNLILLEDKIQILPSILSYTFPIISDVIMGYRGGQEEVLYKIPFLVANKIKYNNIEKYKSYLEDYGSYILPVGEYLDLLDEKIPGRKRSFLYKIKRIYLDTLYELNTEKEETILFIQKVTGDFIIDNVIQKIYEKYLKSPNKSNNHSEEDIEVSIIVIVCKSFVECKILENPNI